MHSNVIAYPVSRATKTSFLSADPLWQSISHLVVKWVLGAAKSHMAEYCALIGVQYPVCRGQHLNTKLITPFLLCGSGLARKTTSNSLTLSADWNVAVSSAYCFTWHCSSDSGRLLTQMAYRSRLRIDPWGTSILTSVHSHFSSLTHALCLQPASYFWSNFIPPLWHRTSPSSLVESSDLPSQIVSHSRLFK